MVPLNSLQLTGRESTHVREIPGLAAVRLHPQAHAAIARLREASAAAGIDLEVVSGFRDFERQRLIWNRKFRGERPVLDGAGRPVEVGKLDEGQLARTILIWSALPGASRHHWGTDFDVIDRAALAGRPGYRVELTVAEFTDAGPFVRLNEWLAANLGSHGFFRPYTTDRGGVKPEPWHLSYAPVSVPALESFTLEMLREAIENSDLAGRETVLAQLPELYERYVRAVDSP
jgi:LAS superfamily LD-carboxypeptidase LdcB